MHSTTKATFLNEASALALRRAVSLRGLSCARAASLIWDKPGCLMSLLRRRRRLSWSASLTYALGPIHRSPQVKCSMARVEDRGC